MSCGRPSGSCDPKSALEAKGGGPLGWNGLKPPPPKAAADERFFAVQLHAFDLSDANWTELERQVMVAHRWWSASELRDTEDQIWPEDLPHLLTHAGVWPAIP